MIKKQQIAPQRRSYRCNFIEVVNVNFLLLVFMFMFEVISECDSASKYCVYWADMISEII